MNIFKKLFGKNREAELEEIVEMQRKRIAELEKENRMLKNRAPRVVEKVVEKVVVQAPQAMPTSNPKVTKMALPTKKDDNAITDSQRTFIKVIQKTLYKYDKNMKLDFKGTTKKEAHKWISAHIDEYRRVESLIAGLK